MPHYPERLHPYLYQWPHHALGDDGFGPDATGGPLLVKDLNETPEQLAADSRWPLLMPSAIAFITARHGAESALEKVTAPAIVNRFPLTLAVSFCREGLSGRHHARQRFMTMLEAGGEASLQFLPPGPGLDHVWGLIRDLPEAATGERLLPLAHAPGVTVAAPCLEQAYLIYECRLAAGEGAPNPPWRDVGSHRVYFLEVSAIQLRRDLAAGDRQLRWRSLPIWEGAPERQGLTGAGGRYDREGKYWKTFNPDYHFPAVGTVAFQPDRYHGERAVRLVARELPDQVTLDNDQARWPCFFPSSLGMVTCWSPEGKANLMPCGSVTVVSRHPLTIAVGIAAAGINQRYGRRASLDFILERGWFGCGVCDDHPLLLEAITYTGNVSHREDPDKAAHAGLAVLPRPLAPALAATPLHVECRVSGHVALGSHDLVLGEVRAILAHPALARGGALTWCPWADVEGVLS